MTQALYILLGLALGLVIGWLLRATRKSLPDTRVEAELRSQLEQQKAELGRTGAELSAAKVAAASAHVAKISAERAEAEQRQLQQQCGAAASQAADKHAQESAALRERLTQLGTELAQFQAQLAAERTALGESRTHHQQAAADAKALQSGVLVLKTRNGELDAEVKFLNERLATERQQLESLHEKFRKDFEAVSNKLLVDTSSKFNQQSSESLAKLLAPLKESLGEFKSGLDTTRKETAAHSALLKDQIARIGTEAANLTKALKGDVKTLGNWGENMLDQILEKSGLQQGVHYRRQIGAKDADGSQRFLDVIIDLPEKRNLVIDSKVPLRAYEESVNAPDDATRGEQLDKHVEAVRKHFRDLGGKRYQDIHGIGAPDFVLMYVPIEAAFFAAIAREPGLFGDALDRNVVLITNSTLLATLRTVAHVWRLADQQKHALEIAERGGLLYDKFVGFVEDVQNIGRALGAAQKAWDGASDKLSKGTGNLVGQVEKLKKLGAKAAKALPASMTDGDDEIEPSPVTFPPTTNSTTANDGSQASA